MGLKPFEHIVDEHGPTVLRVCRAVVGYQDAEDAWADTFLAALRAYPDLEPGTNVEAWLVTIAKHKAIDQHRSSERRAEPVDRVRDLASVDNQQVERNDDLWSALRALPTKQREAVAYHHVAGMPYAQVATILGNTEMAARRAAADGIKTLRKTYEGVRQ